MPNGYDVFLQETADFSKRLENVNRIIVEYNDGMWCNYFNDNWLNETSDSGLSYNKTKNILDRAATYLLFGNFRESNSLTGNRARKIAQTEIPVSNAPNDVSELFYSATEHDYDERTKSGLSQTPQVFNEPTPDLDIYYMGRREILESKALEKKAKKRWRETRAYRLNKLYSTDEIRTYKIRLVKAASTALHNMTSNNPVLEIVPKKIGGNKGMINPATKFQHVPEYLSKWCSVDIDNVFSFDGKKFKIDSSVKEYEVKNSSNNSNDFTNESEMDSILAFRVPDKGYVFFNQNIDKVDSSLVKELDN